MRESVSAQGAGDRRTRGLLAIIFAAASAVSSSTHAEVPPSDISRIDRKFIVSREKNLQIGDLSAANRKRNLNELVDRYVKLGRLQEAIWVLRENQEFQLAEVIERQLIQVMSAGEIEQVHEFEGSADLALLGRIRGTELYGVFKKRSAYSRFELAAYQLDRLLNLNIVPLTIARPNVTRGEVDAFQYFVRGAVSAREALKATGFLEPEDKAKMEFKYYGYPSSQKKMWLLDFLIENTDRHGENWMWSLGEQNLRPVAIDHGMAFGRSIRGKVEFSESNLPDGEVLENLSKLDGPTLKREFQSLLTQQEIRALARRVKQVVVKARTLKLRRACANLF